MNRAIRSTLAVGSMMTLATLTIPTSYAQTAEYDGSYFAVDSSSDFKTSFASTNKKLLDSSLNAKLEDAPGLGSETGGEYERTLAAIRAKAPIPGVSVGSVADSYDVIIQPGHYGRVSGRLGTAGRLVSEQALASYIVGRMAAKIRAGGAKVLVVPADGSPAGLKAKVFLAIHADGSAVPCKTGPSMAYKRTGSLMPMHAVGFGLARAYGYSYEEFRKDNFTVDERDYYMFGKVSAPLMTGLLEVGELTCEKSEKRLIASSDVIADNVASALIYVVQTK